MSWDDGEANGQQIWLPADAILIEATGQQAQQVNLWSREEETCINGEVNIAGMSLPSSVIYGQEKLAVLLYTTSTKYTR